MCAHITVFISEVIPKKKKSLLVTSKNIGCIIRPCKNVSLKVQNCILRTLYIVQFKFYFIIDFIIKYIIVLFILIN